MTATAAELARFREAVEARIGFRCDGATSEALAELLVRRSRQRGVDLQGYVDGLDSDELTEIARHLTVAETYFLRNEAHYAAFADILRARASGSRRLRILSAGCASGEEAYSIAIVAHETLADIGAWDLQIVGVDINPDTLARAAAARYSKWSLRAVPPEIQKAYLPAGRGDFGVAPRIARHVTFEQLNLLDDDDPFWQPARFDVIFCRNVIMYFTTDAARRVVARLSEALAPQGYLFLGHAENLRGLSRDFHLCHSHETFYYRRREAGESTFEVVEGARRAPVGPLAPALDVSWMEEIANSTARIRELSAAPAAPQRAAADDSADLGSAYALFAEERFDDALRLLSPRPSDSDPEALLLRATILASSGKPSEAEAVCARLLAVDELNSGAHYIAALCREHCGDIAAAIEHDRVAAYLDPDFAMPHLQLGILARRRGDLPTARHEIGTALDLLARESSARIVLFGGGFTRDALQALCRAELQACGGAR